MKSNNISSNNTSSVNIDSFLNNYQSRLSKLFENDSDVEENEYAELYYSKNIDPIVNYDSDGDDRILKDSESNNGDIEIQKLEFDSDSDTDITASQLKKQLLSKKKIEH